MVWPPPSSEKIQTETYALEPLEQPFTEVEFLVDSEKPSTDSRPTVGPIWPRGGAAFVERSLASNISSIVLGQKTALPDVISIFEIKTSTPSRVRIYKTQAQMNADLSRPVTMSPAADSGCVADVVTTSNALSVFPNAMTVVATQGALWMHCDTNATVTMLYVTFR